MIEIDTRYACYSYRAPPVFSNLKIISAAAPVLWDPRFDHSLIGQHQICRIGISAGPLGRLIGNTDMDNMQKNIRVISVVRWIARAWSIVTIILVLAFIIGEGFNPKLLAPKEWLGFIFFPVGICFGLVIAWWKEGLGAIVVVSSLLAFYIINLATAGTFPKGWAWEAFAFPGFLFAFCWYRSRNVVSAAA